MVSGKPIIYADGSCRFPQWLAARQPSLRAVDLGCRASPSFVRLWIFRAFDQSVRPVTATTFRREFTASSGRATNSM